MHNGKAGRERTRASIKLSALLEKCVLSPDARIRSTICDDNPKMDMHNPTHL